jgi:hypothetical protein
MPVPSDGQNDTPGPQHGGNRQEHRQEWDHQPKGGLEVGGDALRVSGIPPQLDHRKQRHQRQ